MNTRIRSSLSLCLLAAASAAACGGRLGPEHGSALSEQLPIRRVVLYQNGVGYFEREGKLKGDVLTLHCRPHQINDLLKSLTVIDRGSGRPVSVSLPLEKTGAKILAELPRQVRDASGLLDVLRVFRGARVTVEGSRGRATGRVIGVEQDVLSQSGDKPVTGWRLTLKADSGSLVVYPVNAVTRLTLMDRALEVGLDKSLDVSLDEGTWKPVALSVRLTGGDSRHDLLVSYIVEMPNWKPAYRLVIQPERPPLLQGWAVVDNISGESWNNAQLSLVAGTPMSFIYDLHSPRFTQRVDLTPRGVQTALAPTHEQAGYGETVTAAEKAEEPSTKDLLQRRYASRRSAGRSDASPKSEPAPSVTAPPPPPSPQPRPGDVPREDMNIMLEQQIKARVQGKQVGSLFRYDLKDAVTVPDSSSTLVNIVNTRVKGGEVVLFRPELTGSFAASHPYRAVRLGNTTGFTLEKGPVTIYSAGTFVGEGFLERMEQDSTIFLTYAIDGQVTASRTTGWGEEVVRLLKIAGGQIHSETLNIDRREYELQSRHDQPITAFIKSIPRGGYTLRNAPADTVKTAEASYVPVILPARGKRKITIEWISPVQRWLAVDTTMATTVLKLFLSKGKVPDAIRPTLQKILAAKGRLEEIRVELERIKKVKNELSNDQSRVRDNLDLLRKVKGNAELRARLTRNLAALEGNLTKLTGSYVKLDEERARLLGTMRALIGEINLDAGKGVSK